MNQAHNFERARHDLVTYLNHIVGYCEILIADVREYGHLEFIPGINQILQKAEKLKRIIHYHFDINELSLQNINVEEIKKALYLPLMEVISDSRRLLVLIRQHSPRFLKDMEQLLNVANQMHEMVESEIIDLQLQELGRSQETKVKEFDFDLPDSIVIETDDTIEGQQAKIPARVLVIDDSTVYHRLITRHLQALGHKVHCVLNGSEGIEYLQKHEIDIVILDVLIPVMTGHQILKILKNMEAFKKIPVIMMSAVANSASIAECIRLGAEDYLPKDFDPAILKARLDACMEKKILQDQQNIFIQAVLESQKALANELSDAASYIVGLLPPPLEGDVKGALTLIPSAQLGGDFCAYHWLSESKLALYLMDISGHGIKSALLAVSLSNMINNRGLPDVDFYQPGSVLSSLNKVFQSGNYHSLYFSLWYGIYDKTSGLLSYASGGSPPACVVRKDQDSVEQLNWGDLVLGADETYQYQSHTCSLRKGDKLFVYSDGLYEISKSNGRRLGLSEFQNLLPLQKESPRADLENLLHSVLALTMNESFQDDISILELEF